MSDYRMPSLATHIKRKDAREEKEKKRRGRPPKSALEKKNPVGRPKGDASIINEYKARMLASPKSAKVIEAIYDAALDPEHKNQSAAWKLVMDRILPVAAFEKDVIANGGKPTIQINFGSVSTPVNINNEQIIEDDIIDGDIEE